MVAIAQYLDHQHWRLLQLNERSMRPRRDYQTNRLVPGRLQLPPASQVLLDETTMAPGTLAPAGVANLQVRATGGPGPGPGS